jgi:hypothetical protein
MPRADFAIKPNLRLHAIHFLHSLSGMVSPQPKSNQAENATRCSFGTRQPAFLRA